MQKIHGESEQDLIRKAGKRDAAAMKVIYDLNVRYLSAVCARYIPAEEDLKDVLQESFIKIFSALGKFDYKGAGSLKAWMKRIVVNEALMFIRKKERGGFISFSEEPPEVLEEEEPQVEEVPPEILQSMIMEMPPGYRTVLNLYIFEEKSHKEISSLLGISENTSFSQFHRAKNLLAKRLKDYLNNEK